MLVISGIHTPEVKQPPVSDSFGLLVVAFCYHYLQLSRNMLEKITKVGKIEYMQ